MDRSGNNSEGEIPQMVVSYSQFRANPQGVIDALFSNNELPADAINVATAHISRLHNYGGTRAIMAMMFFNLFFFVFINSQNVFLGLTYLVSGLLSLGLQNYFYLVTRLDNSCSDNASHIYLIKLCYLIGLFLWLIPYSFILGCENACAKYRQNMLSDDNAILYFMGFIAVSMSMGFLIILPATIVNEITAVFKTLLCCGNRSYGSLGPQNGTERGSVELSGGEIRIASESPPRFGQKNNPLRAESEGGGMRKAEV